MAKTKNAAQKQIEANEDTTNELIAIIWPLLDKGYSRDEIQAMIHNVLDSWEPVKSEKG